MLALLTVTLIARVTLTVLALVLLATATLAIFLIAEELKDRRDRRTYSHRLTSGGTVTH